jgi:F0F1-type ATP synthase assembly protein I
MNALLSFAHLNHLFGSTSYDTYNVDMSNAAASAVLGGLMLFLAITLIITYIVVSLLLSRIFRKAGVEGWKAWVPIYNTWITYELGGQKGWWALIMLVPVVNLVASVFLYIAMYEIGLKFGKDGSFVLWAIFLPIVWYVWLAFDQSTWKQSVATANVNHFDTNNDNGHPQSSL